MMFSCAAVFAAILSLPAPAAQSAVDSPPAHFTIARLPAFTMARPSRPTYRPQRVSAVARVGVIALGAFGGSIAGGYVGAKLEPNCRCDDPGLKGLLIGAPIGAILGGIAAAYLTR